MKQKYIIGSLLLVAMLFTGCGILDQGYQQEVVFHDASTNSSVFMSTNVITVPAFTNTLGTVVPETTTQVIVPEIRYVVTPPYYTTNLVNRPAVDATVSLVGSLPVPFAGLIATVFGGLYALYKNIRNKKALLAVVQGVEAFRATMQTPELQKIDAKLKDFLIEHQELAGVLDVVSKTVNTYTGDTVPPAK